MNIRRANLDDAFIILLLLKEMHEGTVINIPNIKLECLARKVDNVIKKFPNQYKFLKDWYEGWTVD